MKRAGILAIGIAISIFALVLFLGNLYSEKRSGNKGDDIAFSQSSTLSEKGESSFKSVSKLENKKVVRPEIFMASDLEIPLLFENDVSSEVRQFILKDFEMLFEHAQDYELYDLSQLEKSARSLVGVDGLDLLVEKRLFFLSSRPPTLLHKYLGNVVNQNGVDKLLVPNLILEAYKDAFVLTQKFSVEFEALGDFVGMITNSTEEEPFTLHPKDVFYMPNSPVFARLEQEPELLIEAQKFYSKTTRVRMPSVLNFEEIPQEQQKDGIYLKAKGYSLEGQPAVPSVEIGFVYHNGYWKIFGNDGM